MADSRHDPLVGFFAAAVMAVGALIAALCGACTLLVGAGVAADMANGRRGGGDFRIDLPTVALLGGLPTLFGLGIFFAGRSLWRSANPPRKPK